MKRICQLVCFYITIFVVAIFLQSCCTGDLFISGSGYVDIQDQDDLPGDGKINGPFQLDVYPGLEVSGIDTDYGFMSSAHALSCDRELQNEVVASSLQISCDKEFVYDNTVVSPGTNFIDFTGITFSIPTDQVEVYIFSILFDSVFTDAAEFVADEYTFSISYTTDNNLDLVATGVFELDF
jgi:hypothetical protein